MRAMVLCAGFGTRLRPLTDKVPKPLVPLCGVPLLRYNFALLQNAGVHEIVINVHHLGAEMEKGAKRIAAELGLDLRVSREEKHILGTGGGVKRAQAMLGNETFLVMNGDMIFDLDLPAAIEAHRKAQAMATMVLAPYPRGATYGAVEVDKDFNVRRIAGRGAPVAPGLTRMHFTGVHVFEPAMLSRAIPQATLKLFAQAGHFVFVNTCTVVGRLLQPTVCVDPAGVDREAVHRETAKAAVDFFTATLRP